MASRTGLRKRFTIYLDDDKTIGPFLSGVAEVVLWERQNPGQGFLEGITVTQYLWLAYSAARRQKLLGDEFGRFDDFAVHVVDYSVEDVEDPDPTPAAPGLEL